MAKELMASCCPTCDPDTFGGLLAQLIVGGVVIPPCSLVVDCETCGKPFSFDLDADLC